MAKTRTQMIEMAREWADAVGSNRWSDTRIQEILSDVTDREWRNLLNVQNQLRLAPNVSFTSDANGRYAISGFNTGAGNDRIRLYRILGMTVDDIPYTEGKLNDRNNLLAEANDTRLYEYWREGDNLVAFPRQATKVGKFWYNHIPIRIEDLAQDSDSIVWPDGYETIIGIYTAVEMLLKGGAESEAAADLRVLAGEKKAEMLLDLGRFSTSPITMKYTDDARDWGGQ